jgi:nitroimidazol reductase NimA-like FMN-containing flavoprotein (pyridoxamine 5'-phosphate oxidase superfamily)
MPTKIRRSPASEDAQPVATLPHMAAEFGLKRRGEYLPWKHAQERLERARNYWIVTAGADGRPHAMPVWGFWRDGKLYFGTARDSRKWRNLELNRHVVVHLESGEDVVIVEGTAREISDAGEIAALTTLYQEKYGISMPLDPKRHVVVVVQPRTAFAWLEKEMAGTATKWAFKSY